MIGVAGMVHAGRLPVTDRFESRGSDLNRSARASQIRRKFHCGLQSLNAKFQRNANFITDTKATTYLFLPAAVNRRVVRSANQFADWPGPCRYRISRPSIGTAKF